MSGRRLRRYVESLLRGTRPRPFPVDDDEAADIRTAITLRAARPGSGAPSEEFVTELHRRLVAQSATADRSSPPGDGQPARPATRPTRRRTIQLTALAAAA